ncbi:hypothetical protein HK098_007959 [Nowakowskiella sp. JEL0407]|nr:hypothetical protein HK098_007959 [Nowakowskiella sp. JEL0407]
MSTPSESSHSLDVNFDQINQSSLLFGSLDLPSLDSDVSLEQSTVFSPTNFDTPTDSFRKESLISFNSMDSMSSYPNMQLPPDEQLLQLQDYANNGTPSTIMHDSTSFEQTYSATNSLAATYSPFTHTIGKNLELLNLNSPLHNTFANVNSPSMPSPAITITSPDQNTFSPAPQYLLQAGNNVYIVPSPLIPTIPSPLNPTAYPGSSTIGSDWQINFDAALIQQQEMSKLSNNGSLAPPNALESDVGGLIAGLGLNNADNGLSDYSSMLDADVDLWKEGLNGLNLEYLNPSRSLSLLNGEETYGGDSLTTFSSSLFTGGDSQQQTQHLQTQSLATSSPVITLQTKDQNFLGSDLNYPFSNHGSPSGGAYISTSPRLSLKSPKSLPLKSPKNSALHLGSGASAQLFQADGVTLYQCPFEGCNKRYTRPYNLKSHYRVHTGERPFLCDICPLSFTREHDLKRHIKLHDGTKPFECIACGKTFARNDALRRHHKTNDPTKESACAIKIREMGLSASAASSKSKKADKDDDYIG